MLKIEGPKPIVVMSNGELWFPENSEDWAEIKKSKGINTIFSSTSSILRTVKESYMLEDIKEILAGKEDGEDIE